jgi:molybdenum cofactor synthesis domain-containing protein
MVLEARRLVDSPDAALSSSTVSALNALGYEEAAQHVYGMAYADWKKRHQKKATDEQTERFNASKPVWAVHDKSLLAVRGDKPTMSLSKSSETSTTTEQKGEKSLLSNVCCQDAEEVASKQTPTAPAQTRAVRPFRPPPIPDEILQSSKPVKIAVLTVSDRASKDEYETGDLSGPAVQEAVRAVIRNVHMITVIVPDDTQMIQLQIKSWCDEEGGVDVILTTGGTGMGPRDITPEATRGVVDMELAGLMAFVTTECSHLQPLASLSRGTAGIRGSTIIANLPGNPKGVGEVVPLLLPLLLHAVQDLRRET